MQSILPLEINPEFTSSWKGPLDGRDINPRDLKNYGLFPWQISSDNEWWNRPLKKGEIGCAISHWMCWRRAGNSNANLFLILEDDVDPVDGFLPRLDTALSKLKKYDPDWDLLYLGRQPLCPDTAAVEGIVRPGYSHCTFAYMLTRRGVEKLLRTSFERDLIPVDEFLPAMYIDHPREDVRKRYPKSLSAYALEPAIAFQLPKTEAGSDTEESDFYQT